MITVGPQLKCILFDVDMVYFPSGQYKVDLNVTRDKGDKKNIAFEKRPDRKPLRESVGRVEIISRMGDHLPDRSLARSCNPKTKLRCVARSI